jgi:phosphoglycerate kinase
MKTLKDIDFKNKKVLVRCDFNVPLDKNGAIEDDSRIKAALPTIEYLIKKEAKIILMSHLGRPEGKVIEELRLNPVAERLSELLKQSVKKLDDCVGEKAQEEVERIEPGEIILLENVQFNPGEKKNDSDFAKTLASYADIFIMEAFGQAHRNYASIAGISKYLPAAAGFLLEKEIEILSRVRDNPSRPLVVIIGGLKIETKIGVISEFLKRADHLLLGGQVANTILIGKGLSLGRSLIEDEELAGKVKKIDITIPKIHLPVDGLIAPEEGERNPVRMGAVGTIKAGEKIYDIGPETISVFSEVIKTAKMILWAGPLGLFEDERFGNGTRQIALVVTGNKDAFKIVGGGDTIASIDKLGLLDKFNHVSTGGGAMLEFLAGEKLPGIEALK